MQNCSYLHSQWSHFHLEHQPVACPSFFEICKLHLCSMSKRTIRSLNACLCRDFPICVIHFLLYLAPPSKRVWSVCGNYTEICKRSISGNMSLKLFFRCGAFKSNACSYMHTAFTAGSSTGVIFFKMWLWRLHYCPHYSWAIH